MSKSSKAVHGWGIRLAPWVLIAPNLLIFGIFIVIPALIGAGTSLLDWDGLARRNFVGLGNYAALFRSAAFWEAFGRTTIYALICVPLVMGFALLLANLMIKQFRLKGLFRAVFYWPTMISFIITGLSFKFIFGDSFGIINYLLRMLGQSPIPWLTRPSFAWFVLVLATVWSRAGFYMVTFISGLNSIPQSYYEACDVDGANSVQKFFRITLPLLKPTTFLVLILLVIDMFKAYPIVRALTEGGPSGSTRFIVQLIYEEAFTKSHMGYASAMSIVLFLILGLFTIIQFKINQGGEVK